MKHNIRLENNESPWAPQDIYSKLFDIDWDKVQLNRYLCQDDGPLIPALAEYAGVDENQLVVSNGGDDLILEIFNALSGSQKKVLLNPPTFGVYYSAIRMIDAVVYNIPLSSSFQLQTAEMIETVKREGIGVVMICRPNNPTGNLCPEEDILKIVEKTDAFVVVDEAYYEFAGSSMLKELASHKKLVLLRTMSKAFAAAGLRIGYAIAAPDVRSMIREKQMYYNISNLSQFVGSRLLQNSSIFMNYVQEVIEIREEFRRKLNALPGIQAFPSYTNFFMVGLDNPQEVQNLLLNEGIAVKKICHAHESLKRMIRISVGSRTENDIVIQSLQRYGRGH